MPIKCMRSPHTSNRWRGERHRANKMYALTTHQLQVERRERLWRGERGKAERARGRAGSETSGETIGK